MDAEDYTAPEGAPWPLCWVCLKPFNGDRRGVCIEGGTESQVCLTCWKGLPPTARVAFRLFGPTAAWVRWALSAMPHDAIDADWWKRFTRDDGREN